MSKHTEKEIKSYKRNYLLPVRRQVTNWNNADLLSIEALATNASEILIKSQIFPFKKTPFKMSNSGNFGLVKNGNTWWRHQMETFSAFICAGNSPVTGEFPTQRPVTRSFDIFFHLRLYSG